MGCASCAVLDHLLWIYRSDLLMTGEFMGGTFGWLKLASDMYCNDRPMNMTMCVHVYVYIYVRV
jgi:hypothetical protein